MTEPKFSTPTEYGRYYIRPGTGDSVPSITNIIGMKDKPGLKWWGAKQVASYVSHNLDLFRRPGLKEEEAFSLARYTPFAKTASSPAVIGDVVHNWIDRDIKGDPPGHAEVMEASATARHMYEQWRKFVAHYKPEITASEFTVWSEKHGYAGTMDLSMKVAGHHVLVDTKTGNNVYPDYGMQLAAGANADIMLDADGRESPVPEYDKYALLHLRPRSFALYPVERIDEAFEAFLALKKVFDWNLKHAPNTIRFVAKHSS